MHLNICTVCCVVGVVMNYKEICVWNIEINMAHGYFFCVERWIRKLMVSEQA
jgi:hypothetical protein